MNIERAIINFIKSFFSQLFKILFLPSNKGEWGERQTALEIQTSLDRTVYKAIHDIIIPSSNGTSQLDHIVLSKYGVFIIETKNKGGWIFGDEKRKNWTQTFFKKKYSFQNPLKQAYRQKKVLAGFLDLKESNIHTVVHFVGKCKFKTQMPVNVIKYELGSYIESFRIEIFSAEQVVSFENKLRNHIENTNLSSRDHIESLNKRLNSIDTCPNCGGFLSVKMAKKGARAGSKFLGCSNFPKCRFSKNI